MSKKKSYEEIKKIIESKENCELLSTEYINTDEKLLLKCKCGKIFERSFSGLKKGQMLCHECQKNRITEGNRLNFEEIKKYIKKNECEYISGEYVNVSSKLTLKCKCGNIFSKSYAHFKRGQNRCNSCANISLRKNKIKYTREKAEEILSNKGITLIGDYIDSVHDIKCICKKGHKFTTKLVYVLYNNFGCLQCSRDYYTGEKANHYKGGESEVLDKLRKNLKQWKKDVAKKYNYACFLTGSKKDCVVHHIIPFMKIVKDSCKELNIPLYKKIGDYEPEIFKKLEKLILKKHTLDIGVLLQRKIHYKFHSIYGKEDNNLEQFLNFCELT